MTGVRSHSFLTESPAHPGGVSLLSCACCEGHKMNRAIQKYHESQKVRYKILSPLFLQRCHLIHPGCVCVCSAVDVGWELGAGSI